VSNKILIATRSFGSTSPKPFEVITDAGFEYVQADMSQEMDESRLTRSLEGVSGAIVGVVPMTARVMENTPDLKVVSMHGVGVDHIDLEAAARQGIVIANCPGTNDQPVADLTIGLMIAAARSIPIVDRELRQGSWGRYQGGELWNKTLGLIGFGRIGQGVAKRALGFDMQVLVYDPYVNPKQVGLNEVKMTNLNDVIAMSDFISLHTPLSSETHHMIGKAQLERMKTNAYLINTARGGLVDEGALYEALLEKRIAGAALDVFVDEPPTGSPLLTLDSVVVTPHIGAHTRESIERMGVMAAQNVVRALQGAQPHNRVV
jgi:D-3-phosphoglycerate dehydrogenase